MKYTKIKDVWVESDFMLCRNDECAVVVYNPQRYVTGPCPGCDEIGTIIGRRTRNTKGE